MMKGKVIIVIIVRKIITAIAEDIILTDFPTILSRF
jgi:hypothetical protein